MVARFTVEILATAEAEFRQALLWYFERSPIFANALRIEVLTKIDSLREDADRWPRNQDGVSCRVLSRRFEYTLFYELVGTHATVLAVASQRRKPGYRAGRQVDPGIADDP